MLSVNVPHHCKQSVFLDDKNDPKWIDMYACMKKEEHCCALNDQIEDEK